MSIADPAKAKIIHVLRDGTVVDSIDGHVVRFEDAEPLYRMLYKMSTGKEMSNNERLG